MEQFFGFILYPVSGLLWVWHQLFGAVFGPDQGISWILSVFFLVFTLRVLLLKPALSQIRAGRKMQKFAPQMQKIREKYKNDRQKMAQEMQRMQSEQGVNPLGGCLPALVQIPVFLSLFHVLRGFDPSEDSNFAFGREGVQSFVNADIFGAKLSNWITQSEQQLEQFDTTRADMIMVGIPLMIVASVATYFTMRMSMKRQSDAAMANPQSAMMGKVMMYLAPIGALVSGWFLPLAVLFYWLANNVWTLGQQHFLTNKVDREEERRKEEEIAAKKEAPRPKPGQKPKRDRQGSGGAATDEDVEAEAGTGDSEEDGGPTGAKSGSPSKNGSAGKKTTQGANGSKTGSGGSKSAAGAKSGGGSGGAAKSGAKSSGSGGGSGNKKGQQSKNRSGKQTAAQRSQKKRR
ncbi:membrane protein insertase YidC [Actinopolyspora erythraea]|uniref:Membrane protein insertase YidC n=1 Tax=Actinopolyspora erythraea TaxID=414996 RepID=A0A099DAF7_9ACTN|nr:membrane protein insertase YidC [Actinopolyspora erythraea]ASU79926.1 membrane protein insertase YidC [Actinopolyspora erythraea]KGI82355.1 preprotein translocase subunit YidC [Actinopolyspora erythraea]